jgi:hypothetical protein
VSIEIEIDDLNGSDLQTLASRVGVPAVLLFVKHFGGQRIYVPRAMTNNFLQSVVPVLGESDAQALIWVFGPSGFDVPRHALSIEGRVRLVRAMRVAGIASNVISAKLGIGWRSISALADGRKSLSEPKKRLTDDRQIDLVDYTANLKARD